MCYSYAEKKTQAQRPHNPKWNMLEQFSICLVMLLIAAFQIMSNVRKDEKAVQKYGAPHRYSADVVSDEKNLSVEIPTTS